QDPPSSPTRLPTLPSQASTPKAIVSGGVVYCSGTVATDPATGKIVDGDIFKAHTVPRSFLLPNLGHVLEAAGSDLTKALKVNVFLSDMDNCADMNSVYIQYWGGVKPCRTCVAVKTLPMNTDVEIECIAHQ
ncbi:Endoribonuclease L-PSP, partial [Aspergillus ellipticus CBS 707.79]